MALKVVHGIASDIAESGYYSIMADESTDVSTIEQLVICIHWVDKEMTVREEYISLMPVTQTNADTIVCCLHQRCAAAYVFRIQGARGQCYDGCSTMTGTKNEVTAQIKKLNEKCLLIKNISLLKETLDMAYEITDLIMKSPKREAESHRKQANFWDKWNVISIRYGLTNSENPLPSRWTVQAASWRAILRNYETLMKLWV